MKTSFLLLTCFTICAFGVNAQITLDASNSPHNPDHIDDRRVVESGIALPGHGANISYDYSALQSDSISRIPYHAANDTVFTTATRFNFGSAGLGPIRWFSKYYTEKTNAGIFRVGSFKLPQKEGMGAISGNPMDSINFPGSYSVFEEPGYNLKFPTNYGDVWTANYTFRTDFELTVAAFGLNETPGLNVQYVNQIDSVVGWGTLQIPTENGSSSIDYDVLLIKKDIHYVDSFFLGGNPAPPILLAAFGLTQGSSSVFSRYFFYAPDFERPLMVIELNAGGTSATRAFYSVNDLLSSVDHSYTPMDSKVFPNPTHANNTLTIQTASPMNRAVMQLYDTSGRQLYQQRYEGNASQSFELRLPNDLESGLYIYTLVDEFSKRVAKGKVMVN